MDIRKLHKDDIVTGVLQNNRCAYLFEEADGGVDIYYESAVEEYIANNPDDEDLLHFDYHYDASVYYIGMIKGDDGKYSPDPDAEYSAIMDCDGHYCTQVIASKYAVECAGCSPCYPNQGDIDTPGDACIAYCLPPDVWSDDEMDKSRIFKIELV
jgi:hypothetical protein